MAFGEHKLQICVNAAEIGGGPFRVNVQAAPVHPPSCAAVGDGLYHAIVAESANFTLETFTWFGSAVDLTSSMSELRLSLNGSTSTPTDTALSVRRAGTGLYEVSYRPLQVGEFALHVQLHGQHIAASPYTLCVAHGSPWPQHCRASGDGLIKAVERKNSQFVVETFDRGQNRVLVGGAAISAVLRKPTTPPSRFNQSSRTSEDEFGDTEVDVTDLGDGCVLCLCLFVTFRLEN
jgi:hypothetical protein